VKFNRYLPRKFRPEVYQGKRRPVQYFEGWYYKFVDAGGQQIWSVIPGVSYSDDSHSFVQVINAKSGASHYLRYPLEAFGFNRKEWMIEVDSNRFSGNRVSLDLDSGELSMRGSMELLDTHRFPVSAVSPGIMGWYGYVPFMECYHGVVSMQHGLSGKFIIDGSEFSFDGGKGYIEKDWGKSMPSDWIWIQSNHFTGDQNASFMISLARIPWLRGYFPGFLGFLLADGKLYRFATYNRSRVAHLEVSEEKVSISVLNSRYRMEFEATLEEGVVLKAPRHGMMDRDIRESMVAGIHIALKNRKGEMIFSGTGKYAGVEIVGRVEQYFRNNN
jgi:hypothetical protein